MHRIGKDMPLIVTTQLECRGLPTPEAPAHLVGCWTASLFATLRVHCASELGLIAAFLPFPYVWFLPV